jgi:hypothetical protein
MDVVETVHDRMNEELEELMADKSATPAVQSLDVHHRIAVDQSAKEYIGELVQTHGSDPAFRVRVSSFSPICSSDTSSRISSPSSKQMLCHEFKDTDPRAASTTTALTTSCKCASRMTAYILTQRSPSIIQPMMFGVIKTLLTLTPAVLLFSCARTRTIPRVTRFGMLGYSRYTMRT